MSQKLLSPLEYSSVDEWRRAVCRESKALLGADLATFQLPNPEGALFFSEELAPEVIAAYPSRIESLDRWFGMWRRMVGHGACNREMLWGSDIDEYQRDSYYHEFVVPARGFDALIAAMAVDPARVEAQSVAALLFHHDSPSGIRFGERGLALVRLLRPAFQAGVQSYWRLHRFRTEIGRLLDTLGEGVVLFDTAARVVHENAAYSQVLAGEPGNTAVEIRGQSEVLARSLCASLHRERSSAEGLLSEPLMREVRTARSSYTLSAAWLDESVVGRGPAVLVRLERAGRAIPAAESLRQRFGLTAQEAKVALLLAEGKANQEIAGLLFISPHTARRHTERVMQKLDVRSRSEIACRVF